MSRSHTLQDAIAAVRAGDMDHAQLIAIGIVRDNPDDANGWYLLSQLVDSDARRAAYLSKALALDPSHARARIEFDALPPVLVADLAPAAAISAPDPAAAWQAADAPDDEDDQDTPTTLAAEAQVEVAAGAQSRPGADLPEWLQPLGAQPAAAAQPRAQRSTADSYPPSSEVWTPAAPARPAAVKKKKKKNSGNQALAILLGLLTLLTLLVLGFLVYLLLF